MKDNDRLFYGSIFIMAIIIITFIIGLIGYRLKIQKDVLPPNIATVTFVDSSCYKIHKRIDGNSIPLSQGIESRYQPDAEWRVLFDKTTDSLITESIESRVYATFTGAMNSATLNDKPSDIEERVYELEQTVKRLKILHPPLDSLSLY